MGISLHHAALFSTGGTTSNVGDVVDLLHQVSGTALSLHIDGNISPPVDEVAGAGESQIPPVECDGNTSSRIDHIRAAGTSLANLGNVVSKLDTVTAYALGSSVAFGAIGKKKDEVYGFGSVANCFGDGRIYPKLDLFHGSASTQQTAFGNIMPQKDAVSGSATTYLVGVNKGRVYEYLHVVRGSTLVTVTGSVSPPKERIYGSGGSFCIGFGEIISPKERISARSFSVFSIDTLDYSRDAIDPPGNVAASPSKLSFIRDTAVAGETSPLGVITPLSFNRSL